MAPYNRRDLYPRHLCRAGQTLTIAPHDRREIFTELEAYCRCYHSPESISRHRSRSRLKVSQDKSVSTDLAISEDGQSEGLGDDAPPAQGGSSTD
jgi:hypothetical protein